MTNIKINLNILGEPNDKRKQNTIKLNEELQLLKYHQYTAYGRLENSNFAEAHSCYLFLREMDHLTFSLMCFSTFTCFVPCGIVVVQNSKRFVPNSKFVMELEILAS